MMRSLLVSTVVYFVAAFFIKRRFQRHGDTGRDDADADDVLPCAGGRLRCNRRAGLVAPTELSGTSASGRKRHWTRARWEHGDSDAHLSPYRLAGKSRDALLGGGTCSAPI